MEGELGEATLPDYVENEEEVGEDEQPDPSYTPLYADRVRKDTSETSGQENGSRVHQRGLTSRGENVGEVGCTFCHAVIRQSDPKFCPNCGARLHLQPRVVASTYLEARPEAEKQLAANNRKTHDCIVCNEELTEEHDVVWCPYCGQPAHRKHMIEWIREKGRCPNCGASLDERPFKG